MADVNVPLRYRAQWKRPWTRLAKHDPQFRRWLISKGRLSPHFTLAEAACHDGTPLPLRLRDKAQDHAFNLERFRHEAGDPALPVLSWYRTPAYNRKIGGATQSQHMQGDATDFDKATVQRVGVQRWSRAAEKVFAKGGVGTYPAGSRHLDSRGYKARWTSF